MHTSAPPQQSPGETLPGAHTTQLKAVFCWCQSPRTLPPWNTHLLASLEAGPLRWPSAGSWEGPDPSFSGFPTCPSLGALSHFAHRASCPRLAGAPASQPPSVMQPCQSHLLLFPVGSFTWQVQCPTRHDFLLTASVPSLGEVSPRASASPGLWLPAARRGSLPFIVPPLGGMASEQHPEPLPPPLPTWLVEAASQPQQSLLLLGSSGQDHQRLASKR